VALSHFPRETEHPVKKPETFRFIRPATPQGMSKVFVYVDDNPDFEPLIDDEEDE
jgi:hypothetical protein